MNEWTSTDEKNLRARWRSKEKYQSIEWWAMFFRYVKACPWLMGHNDRGWQTDLRWMVKAENFAKITSGRYGKKKTRADGVIENWLRKKTEQMEGGKT